MLWLIKSNGDDNDKSKTSSINKENMKQVMVVMIKEKYKVKV